jgi:hypothetical protein
VLVSQEVVEASVVDGLRYTDLRPVQLKGMSGPMRLDSARRA